MTSPEEEEFIAELKDIMKGGYWTHAIHMLDENNQVKNSKKGQKLKKEIYEGLLQDSREYIDRKLRKIKEFEKHKNYEHSDHEIKICKYNIAYLEKLISRIDDSDKAYNKFLQIFRIFKQNAEKTIENYEKELKKIKEDEKKHLHKIQEKRRQKDHEFYEKEDKPKVRLFIDTRDGDPHEHWIEYLPWLGTTTIRLRIVIYDEIDEVLIRPRFSPELYSHNVEWTGYVGGLNDEHYDYDIRHGFFATYGGGHAEGFKIMKVKEYREEFAFIFLRHTDTTNFDNILDYSITIEAVEEHGTWKEEVLHHVNIKLKYPNDIRPTIETTQMPDINDPKCPVYPTYSYNFKNFIGRRDMKYKEITFQGNMLANYVPRWIPTQKISYTPITQAIKDNLNNLKVRVYPDGDVRIFYYFGTDDRRIGHLKGNISKSVFHDPLQMVTADMYRFYHDDLVVVRVWFWWIDQKINEIQGLVKHEMPDFERVDFIINLKDPQRDKNMIPFIATDVHWKEFWVDTREENKTVDMKFTTIGFNFINWKQLVAFFSHHVGILYNPLPAVIHEIFSDMNDPANFYCVSCGNRMEPPQNVAALTDIMEDFEEGALNEKEYHKRTDKIKADHLTDMMCPICNTLIRGEEKLQYLYLFEDFSKLHKHLYDEVLAKVLEKSTEGGGGKAIDAKIQNCHVPTPVQGDTSHEWCSSTVIKALTRKEIESDIEFEAKLHENMVEQYDITEIEGLDGKMAAKLYRSGVVKVKDLINTDLDTLRNVDLTGFRSIEVDYYMMNIEQWKHMAELMQIDGIGPEYADLLVEIGESLGKLKNFSGDPDDLHDKLEEYNDLHNDVQRLPGVKALSDWIQQAKNM